MENTGYVFDVNDQNIIIYQDIGIVYCANKIVLALGSRMRVMEKILSDKQQCDYIKDYQQCWRFKISKIAIETRYRTRKTKHTLERQSE